MSLAGGILGAYGEGGVEIREGGWWISSVAWRVVRHNGGFPRAIVLLGEVWNRTGGIDEGEQAKKSKECERKI